MFSRLFRLKNGQKSNPQTAATAADIFKKPPAPPIFRTKKGKNKSGVSFEQIASAKAVEKGSTVKVVGEDANNGS